MLKSSVFEEREIGYEMNEQVNKCLRLDPGRSLLTGQIWRNMDSLARLIQILVIKGTDIWWLNSNVQLILPAFLVFEQRLQIMCLAWKNARFHLRISNINPSEWLEVSQS